MLATRVWVHTLLDTQIQMEYSMKEYWVDSFVHCFTSFFLRITGIKLCSPTRSALSNGLLKVLLPVSCYSTDLVSTAADALFPLILCEPNLYQGLGNELIEKQANPNFKTRLANALQVLTTSNQLSSSLDRLNYQRFRKNLNNFLVEVRGFLKTRWPNFRTYLLFFWVVKRIYLVEVVFSVCNN
jgi:hypothetical protein